MTTYGTPEQKPGDFATREDLLRMSELLNSIRDATSVPLLEHLKVRLDAVNADKEALKQLTDTQIKAVIAATNLAKESMEHRLAALNEIRGTLADQATLFHTKAEFCMFLQRYEENYKVSTDKLISLELTRASVEGKASQTAVIVAGAMGFIGILIGIAGLISRLL